MATAGTRLMTVEEFAALPEVEDARCELRDGEVFSVTFPKLPHFRLQKQLFRLLFDALKDRGDVDKEYIFQPDQWNLRSVDVAFLSAERWKNAGDEYLHGSPELIVEVISPSNTAQEMSDKRKLFLATGCLEFWVVNPRQKEVDVHYSDGVGRRYGMGQQIPISFAPGVTISVDEIFG